MIRDLKTILIPDGIDDERVDSVLANLLGLSRASVEKLLNAGEVKLGKKSLAKSDRVHTGQIVDVLLPEPANSEAIPKTPLSDLKIIFSHSATVKAIGFSITICFLLFKDLMACSACSPLGVHMQTASNSTCELNNSSIEV